MIGGINYIDLTDIKSIKGFNNNYFYCNGRIAFKLIWSPSQTDPLLGEILPESVGLTSVVKVNKTSSLLHDIKENKTII